MEKINIKKTKDLQKRVFKPSKEDLLVYSSSEAFCSANFNVFLPELDYKEHSKRYREVLFNMYYSFVERGDIDLINNLDLTKLNLIEDSGFIMCSFHYGAYKLLPAALIKNNRKFFVSINNSVSEEIKKANHEFFEKGKEIYGYNAQEKFLHINVEDPNFIFTAKELIDSGYIMVIFIDGNSGLDGIMKTRSKSMFGIHFLDNEIFVKKGLTALSHAYNTPILPVFSIRNPDNENVRIESYPAIYPDLNKTRDAYSQEVTQKLYTLLEDRVKENAFQWEGWIYLHKWLNIENLSKKEESKVIEPSNKSIKELQFNERKYYPFVASNKHFLLDKDTHLSYEISMETKKVIDGNKKLLNKDNLSFYTVNQILI